MKDKERILLLERITLNPKVMTGKPTIRHTRLSVEHILKAYAAGLTFEQLKDDFPFLRQIFKPVYYIEGKFCVFKNGRLRIR